MKFARRAGGRVHIVVVTADGGENRYFRRTRSRSEKNVVADGRGEGFSRVVGREVEALSHGHAELSRHDSQSSPDAQGFLMKDFFLLGAAIWSAGEALQASTHNSKP